PTSEKAGSPGIGSCDMDVHHSGGAPVYQAHTAVSLSGPRTNAYTAYHSTLKAGDVRPQPLANVTLSRRLHAVALLLVIALLTAALPAPANAAVRDYYFTRIGSDQGLSQNTITALLQDPRGFVWVGTQGGLHRYDGQRYTVFRSSPRDPASLPDSFITALAMLGEDALWVGSYSQFLARIDLVSGAIQRYTIPQGQHDEQAERQVMALAGSGNTLWVGSLTGLHRFDPLTGQYDTVIELAPRQLREHSAQQLLFDQDGVLWYASAAGLYRVEQDGGHALTGAPAMTSSLLVDDAGGLWVGREDGLFRLQGDRTLRKVWPDGDDAHDEPADVRSIVQADDG